MLISHQISEVRSQLKLAKSPAKKVALVPTMGALHLGHLSLVKKAAELAEIVIVSIFVNKAQFNDPVDYQKYPNQIADDLHKLENSGASHIFVPKDSEIFPENFSLKIIPTKLVDCLCGKARPGHFEGVALIICKLFNIIGPDLAIFGEKDFQQFLVIKKLAEDLNFDLEILSCQTVREESGLAMSSRNQRLSESSRIKARKLFETLTEIKKELRRGENPTNLLRGKKNDLLKNGFEKIDYLEIRDEENLELIEEFHSTKPSRIFIAAYLNGIRLIDNLPLN